MKASLSPNLQEKEEGSSSEWLSFNETVENFTLTDLRNIASKLGITINKYIGHECLECTAKELAEGIQKFLADNNLENCNVSLVDNDLWLEGSAPFSREELIERIQQKYKMREEQQKTLMKQRRYAEQEEKRNQQKRYQDYLKLKQEFEPT